MVSVALNYAVSFLWMYLNASRWAGENFLSRASDTLGQKRVGKEASRITSLYCVPALCSFLSGEETRQISNSVGWLSKQEVASPTSLSVSFLLQPWILLSRYSPGFLSLTLSFKISAMHSAPLHLKLMAFT